MSLDPVRNLCQPATVTIASAASLSGGINMCGRVLTGIYMPASWTAAGLSFQASPDGVTYYEVQSASAAIAVTAAAGQYIALDPQTFFGVAWIKVRSGTLGTPVAQGASRDLILMCGRPAL